jgi:hypothetical protein
MRKHFRMTFTLLALVCALAITIPLAARAASSSDTTMPPPALQTPHLLLQQQLAASAIAPQATTNNLIYHRGPVMAGITHVYAIFWEPGNRVAANYNALIERYFRDIGSSPLYQITRQYKDSQGHFPTGAVLSGVYVDLHPYFETPLLDRDIQSEVHSVQGFKGWRPNINTIFFVFTGRGENICTNSTHKSCASNSFCAYHSVFNDVFGDTIYATMPYAASFSCNPGSSPNHNDADQTINVTSHEQLEAATDPGLNAWFDVHGAEIGDKCVWTFGARNAQGADVVWNRHPYIVQREWSNARRGCRITP